MGVRAGGTSPSAGPQNEEGRRILADPPAFGGVDLGERLVELDLQRGRDLEEVAHDTVRRVLEDRRLGVLPIVAGAKITGKIVAHVRGEKVLVFKKKRRKSYQKMNGHRQNLTKVLIESITLK